MTIDIRRKTAKDIETAMETMISAQSMLNLNNRSLSGAVFNSIKREITNKGIDDMIHEKKD